MLPRSGLQYPFPFGEGDVVHIEVAAPRPKSLDDAAQIIGPHTTKSLSENTRINRLNLWPMGLEIAQPAFGGALVMPAQLLDIDDVQTVTF